MGIVSAGVIDTVEEGLKSMAKRQSVLTPHIRLWEKRSRLRFVECTMLLRKQYMSL
jgi:hypothetical protein